jgi:hypothetical protein
MPTSTGANIVLIKCDILCVNSCSRMYQTLKKVRMALIMSGIKPIFQSHLRTDFSCAGAHSCQSVDHLQNLVLVTPTRNVRGNGMGGFASEIALAKGKRRTFSVRISSPKP